MYSPISPLDNVHDCKEFRFIIFCASPIAINDMQDSERKAKTNIVAPEIHHILLISDKKLSKAGSLPTRNKHIGNESGDLTPKIATTEEQSQLPTRKTLFDIVKHVEAICKQNWNVLWQNCNRKSVSDLKVNKDFDGTE